MLICGNSPFMLICGNIPFMLISGNSPFMLICGNSPFMLICGNSPFKLISQKRNQPYKRLQTAYCYNLTNKFYLRPLIKKTFCV
jgi:hypothetical protein